MKKVFYLLIALPLFFMGCKDKEQTNEMTAEKMLIGRWNCEKIVSGDWNTSDPQDVKFIFISLYTDGICMLNIEGFEGDDVEASYTFANNVITLTIAIDDETNVLPVEVLRLTETELCLKFPPLEEDEADRTVWYRKAIMK
ncbi:MAG: hypothetical protein LBB41_05845 [Prevotellaceae bacterium]|jgi:hypothetical protein|nr:hypothetical protein [Prevotellaceae bacterium]